MNPVISRLALAWHLCRRFITSNRDLILIFIATSAVVWIGVGFGNDSMHGPGFFQSMSNWDGNHFARIIDWGYSYDRGKPSNVAFFPGYPLIVQGVRKLTRLTTRTAMPVVSLVCLFASLIVARTYLRHGREPSDSYDLWPIMALCFWPMGLFLRMGYSESLFLLLMLLVMLGLLKGWPTWQVAIIIGAATGVRSVGVALLLPLVWHLWCESKSPLTVVRKGLFLGPLACWGLIAYVLFLDYKFNDPTVFVKTQQFWANRPQPSGLLRHLVNLITFEPIWSVFTPGSAAYWKRQANDAGLMFNLRFFNPIYFVMCAALIGFGAWKKWLTTSEWLLSAGLLGIPYITQAYRMVMLGHGRFTCVVFPMFIVLGRLLSPAPPYVQAIVAALMAVQLLYWSALFASWHPVY
ncbi:MAG: mannosyltransferase family protein [Planctomycetaceae bacterium]